MSDKVQYQQYLADELAQLMHLFDVPSTAFCFIQAFWQTMQREWHGIDYYRYLPW
jgi:ribosomal RNA-processing protein 1